jgi:ribonuclease I
MTKTDLRRAARHLRAWARALRESTTVHGNWPEDENAARAEYADMMQLANKLSAHTRLEPTVKVLQ